MNREAKRKKLQLFFILLCAVIVLVFILLARFDSPYLDWDYSDPERAVVGVALHAFEWIFVRVSPLLFIGSIVGLIINRKKNTGSSL